MAKYDTERMAAMWRQGCTWREIAVELGIPHSTARNVGLRHGLRRRKTAVTSEQDQAPTPEDEDAADSLRLSPYVERRIRELGIHGTPVTGNALMTLQDA